MTVYNISDAHNNYTTHPRVNLNTLPPQLQLKIALLVKESIHNLRLTCKELDRSLRSGFVKAIFRNKIHCAPLISGFTGMQQKPMNRNHCDWLISEPNQAYQIGFPNKIRYKNLKDFEIVLNTFSGDDLLNIIDRMWHINVYRVTINLRDKAQGDSYQKSSGQKCDVSNLRRPFTLELLDMGNRVGVNFLLNCQEISESSWRYRIGDTCQLKKIRLWRSGIEFPSGFHAFNPIQLESLEIFSSEISDHAFNELLKACNELKNLSIALCTKITDDTLARLSTIYLKKLTIIFPKKTREFEPSSFRFTVLNNILLRNQQIETIVLRNIFLKISSESELQEIRLNELSLPYLKKLEIENLKLEYVLYLIKCAKNVEAIRLKQCYWQRSINYIQEIELTHLKKIELYHSPWSDIWAQYLIKRSPNIEEITINSIDCTYKSFEGANLENLRSLNLFGSNAHLDLRELDADQWGNLLRRAPRLEKLSMCTGEGCPEYFGDLTGTLQKLKEIKIFNNILLDDNQFKSLTMRSQHLEKVELGCQSYIGDKTLVELINGCPKLEEISIFGCKTITKEGVDFAYKLGKARNGNKFKITGVSDEVKRNVTSVIDEYEAYDLEKF